MSDAPRVVLRSNVGTIAEQARDARARAWRFVLDTHARKNPAAGPSERGGNDGKAEGDSADARIILEGS
jgi:hypothetical protein